jgi:hypothetical protein
MGERPDLKRLELLAKLDEFRWDDVKGLIRYAAQLEARERAYREALEQLIGVVGEWFSGDVPPQLRNDSRFKTAEALATNPRCCVSGLRP